ncbi:hypothetical protein KIL84_013926 [Mauremys mutica]|uniref:Uncharacterized protein n=1 Tax=Mauremys mutica TaxID=74926 RepID=A0A9D4AUQ7_9SAUR|nr:hypothetical protein KIL84_013926 [Mauremys mutica]
MQALLNEVLCWCRPYSRREPQVKSLCADECLLAHIQVFPPICTRHKEMPQCFNFVPGKSASAITNECALVLVADMYLKSLQGVSVLSFELQGGTPRFDPPEEPTYWKEEIQIFGIEC